MGRFADVICGQPLISTIVNIKNVTSLAESAYSYQRMLQDNNRLVKLRNTPR